MHSKPLSLGLFGLLTFLMPFSAPKAQTGETVKIGEASLTVEVARTQDEQQKGLMHRKTLEENRGMLFCLKRDQNIALWMKNTEIDLDALFIDKTGMIFNRAQMKARTTTLHYALGQARYVIETNAGWAKRHGVEINAKIVGLEEICKKPR